MMRSTTKSKKSTFRRCFGTVGLVCVLAASVGATLCAAPSSVEAQEKRKLNINTADTVTLSKLPGLTLAIAQRIVAYREENGPFKNHKDLLKIKRLSQGVLTKFKDRVVFNDDDEDTIEDGSKATTSLQRGSRMEFDARMIRGETAGSGAVFLFERAARPLPSMVDRRESFLDDTVKGVLGDGYVAKKTSKKAKDAKDGSKPGKGSKTSTKERP